MPCTVFVSWETMVRKIECNTYSHDAHILVGRDRLIRYLYRYINLKWGKCNEEKLQRAVTKFYAVWDYIASEAPFRFKIL